MPVGSGTSLGGCQISLSSYVALCRDYLSDWEYEDRLQGSLSASAVTFDVLDGTRFSSGDLLQIDSEYLYVDSVSSNTLTVRRGWRGSTAAVHGDDAAVFRNLNWTDDQLRRWVNESFADMYPRLYIRQVGSLTGAASSEYTLPADVTQRSQIEDVEVQFSTTRMPITAFRVVDEPPELYVERNLVGYTLKVTYVKPFPALSSDDERTTLPETAKYLPVYYACARAMEQNEVKRIRFDSYEVTQDERVSREGSQLNAGRYYQNLYNQLLENVRMPTRGSAGSF